MTLRRRRPGLVYPVNEDWHYVGDTGEPDWYNPGGGEAWQNSGIYYQLGFRLRETGIVDIQGIIEATSDPPSDANIFELPVGYRPSSSSFMSAVGLTTASKYAAVHISIQSNGLVSVVDAQTDPYPGSLDALQTVSLSLQAFLTPASAP